MAPASPSDVYAKELLSSHGGGHAVLNPRRQRRRDRSGLRPHITVGDVVYNANGQLIRLFNCLQRKEEQELDDPDCEFPEGFEPLLFANERLGYRIQVHDDHHCALPIYKGVGMAQYKEHNTTDTSKGLEGDCTFKAWDRRGAVLVHCGYIRTIYSPNGPPFERYIKQHFDSWADLLTRLGLNVKPEQLMFITHADLTAAWWNICYNDGGVKGVFKVGIPSATRRESGAQPEFRQPHRATIDQGPNEMDMENVEDDFQIHVPEWPCGRANQVISVRGYRGRRRLLFRDVKVQQF